MGVWTCVGLEWFARSQGLVVIGSSGLGFESFEWDSWIPRLAGLGMVPGRGQSWVWGGVRRTWVGGGLSREGTGSIKQWRVAGGIGSMMGRAETRVGGGGPR